MVDVSDLAQRMKADWNRRISHDYRFWMSDGYHSDAHMWTVGQRDFSIMTQGIDLKREMTLLDLGCGVGRLLKSAASSVGHVIGLDVSEKAIERARSLLGQTPGLELLVGNGVDLQPIPDESVDVAVSFATVGSIPAEVFSRYLLELNRVLKIGGRLRVQLYAGAEQPVGREDTLHLRAYQEKNLNEAFEKCGFSMGKMEELKLPLQVSYEELGFKAVIVAATKQRSSDSPAQTILETLLPKGEEKGEKEPALEYWMSLNYAEELADRGDFTRAQETLEYAANLAQSTAIDVRDILERVATKIEKGKAATGVQAGSGQPSSPDLFDKNMRLLEERFPKVAAAIRTAKGREGAAVSVDVSVHPTPEGPVVFSHGQCLDHPSKPVTGASIWAERISKEDRFRNCKEILVLGAGGGYHLSALLKLAHPDQSTAVVEPDAAVMLQVLKSTDCSNWLAKISSFTIGEDSLPDIAEGTELWIRPQTQAIHAAYAEKLKSHFYGTRGIALLNPMIGVVGPLQGGTLPMIEYVSRALGALNQRTRVFDLSGFNQGYLHLERFIKEPLRRTGIENTYCEMISQVVLESINEKPIDILFCMALAPISPRVLTELRNRGILTVLWFVEDYGRFTYWKESAKFYDFIFTIQKGKCIDAIRKAGASEVYYVPTACDPSVHAPQSLSEEEKKRYGSPISFMGAGYHNRQQIFASLAEMPLKIWGTEWPACRPFDRLVQEGGRRIAPAEYVKIFSGSDININLHSSSERDGVDPFGDFLNPRTFELAASGAFQLVDKRSLLGEAFEEGKEVATFSSPAELKDKISYYLKHPEERQAIADAARERALRDHTYASRVRQMLSIIYSSKYQHLKNRLESAPWKRLLHRAKPHQELYERCECAFKRGEEPSLDALVSDIVTGQGKLTDTEGKLLFLFHVCKQIIRMKKEEMGHNK